MSLRWFGVKTLYRTSALGRPKATDRYYDPLTALLEERVVLFKARNFDEAIRKAEREAGSYTKSSHLNPYGQKVKTVYLGHVDAFELFDPPAQGVEVFSSTDLIRKRTDMRTVTERKLGKKEKRGGIKSGRKKFLNQEFVRRVY